MALPYGIRHNVRGSRSSLSDVIGRTIGFLMVGGPALAILGGVVLLPPYAALAQAKYELGCKQAGLAEADAQVRANERLIRALPVDEVLTKRVAESRLRCRPPNEMILPTAPRSHPPDLVIPQPHRRPAQPPQWLMTAARKLSHPPVRRAMLLLALGALVTAIYLFTPPQWPSRQKS